MNKKKSETNILVSVVTQKERKCDTVLLRSGRKNQKCLKSEASQAQVRELEQNFPSQHEVTNTECPSKTHNREWIIAHAEIIVVHH